VKYSTHKQIEDNQIDLVKLLVGRGGKVSLADVSGDTPFDLAIQCDFYDCADLLTELGKDEEKMAIEQEFYQKIDDIYEACQKGDLEVVEELLPQVIVIINQCKKNNMTLLML
jgi:ankyrin repeat protein